MGKIMFLECEYGRYRELWYASCVAKRIADACRDEGQEVIELRRPSPSDANSAIKEHDPDLIYHIGHGNKKATTLERVNLWIKMPDYNTKILNGRGECAESCLTGARLGKYLTEKEDCKAYLGYDVLYYFMWCDDPEKYNCACQGKNPWGVREELWKKMVECMHESTLYYVLGLAKGMTAKEANDYSKKRFDYWIKYFEDVKPKNNREAAIIKLLLWILSHDQAGQVLHGDPNWKLPITPPIPEWIPMAVGVGLLGATIGSIGGYSEEIGKFLGV